MHRLLVLAGIGLIGGCAVAHDVAKLGPDTYTVSANAAPARGGASGARSLAVNAAGAYCERMSREVLVTNISGQTTNVYGAGSVDVTFRCLQPGDPQLQRPTHEKAPDVIVQNRR